MASRLSDRVEAHALPGSGNEMMVRVPSSLRRLAGSRTVVEEVGAPVTIDELFRRLDVRFPGFREQVCEPDGRIKRYLHIFVNGADVRNLQGLDTVLANSDEVSIVPAMAGG
jgi:sulfur-carrier protein